MAAPDPVDALEVAEALLARATAEPTRVLQQLPDATAALEPAVAGRYAFARGLALRTLARGNESTEAFEAALDAARKAGDRVLEGRVARSLAFNMENAGRSAEADALIERSLALLDGEDRTITLLQKAFISIERAEYAAALGVIDEAIPRLERSGNAARLALPLYNRAAIHRSLGDFEQATADLERCLELAERNDDWSLAADAALHIAQIAAGRGRIPDAIRWHRRSRELRDVAGDVSSLADVEHALLLVDAGLFDEAGRLLETAVPDLAARGGNEALMAQARIIQAELAIEAGRFDVAREVVEAGREAIPDTWRFRAELDAMSARVAGLIAPDDPVATTALADMARALEARGERPLAEATWLEAAAHALGRGDAPAAAASLGHVGGLRRRGAPAAQIRWWGLTAWRRHLEGDRGGARRALRAAARRLARHRATLAAPELQVRAAHLASELRRIGYAVLAGDPRAAVAWTEILRGGFGADTPVPDEAQAALDELRQIDIQLRRGQGNEAELRRRRRNLEIAAQDAIHAQVGSADRVRAVDIDTVREALGGRRLIVYLDDGSHLAAVIVDAMGEQWVELGDVDPIASELPHVAAALRRMARPGTSPRSLAAARATLDAAAASLRTRLLGPLNLDPSACDDLDARQRGAHDGGVVVVPGAAVADVPWTMLGIPVEVAPSVAAWTKAQAPPAEVTSAVVVPSGELEHAADEATRVAEILSARVVAPTVAAVRAALADADVLHLSCHAVLRHDRPMFSTLRLDDGDLYLSELFEAGAPRLVILAACEAGAAAVRVGDAALGIADTLLGAGAGQVIAPVAIVSDAAAADVMVRFHEARQRLGSSTAALAAVRANDDPLRRATAEAFVAFGRDR